MKKKQKTLHTVNCNDEQEMKSLGYRNSLISRDKTVWTKTELEKKLLKKVKRRFKKYEFSSNWDFHKPHIPCYDKLIVQIYKNPNFLKKKGYPVSHTTFSFYCGQSDIPHILSKFTNENGESFVRYYKFNGKEYKPNELPFYYW